MAYQADIGMGYQPMEVDDSDQQKGFFRKVFGIVAAQLFYTAFICTVCMGSPTITEFLIENVWLVIVFVVLGVISMCLPWCSKTMRQRVPHNYINLAVFVSSTQTTCFALVVALPCVVYPPELVIVAGLLTLLVTMGCVMGAFQATKSSYCGVMIFWAMAFNVFGCLLLMIFFPISAGSVVLRT